MTIRGRPREITEERLDQLKLQLDARLVRSIEGVIRWFAAPGRVGGPISNRTARRCCKRLGYWLPLRDKRAKGNHRRYRWTKAQIAEIEACARQLGPRRTTALKKIGTEVVTMSTVSTDCGVPYGRLRLDAEYLSQGKLKRTLSHTRKGSILELRRLKPSFFKWCNQEHELTGKPPSAAEAQKALKSEFRIKMPLRTVYTRLAEWKKERSIRPRRYTKRKEFRKAAKTQVTNPVWKILN